MCIPQDQTSSTLPAVTTAHDVKVQTISTVLADTTTHDIKDQTSSTVLADTTAHDIKDQTSSTVLADTTSHDVTTEAAFVSYDVTPVMSVTHQQLSRPHGVAIHPQTGDVYVTSYRNNALCVFSRRMYDFISCTDEWQTPNNTAISLMYPRGIAITPDGSIILGDYYRIIMIEDGVATKSWGRSGQTGNGLGEFSNIFDIAVDGSGLIYVADYNNRRIQVIDPITSDIHLLGEDVISGAPTAVTINPVNRDILVTTSYPNLVLVFDDRGRYKRNDSLSYIPYGLFVDRRGYILMTDVSNSAVHIYDLMWHKVQSFGRLGSCSSCFNYPIGITVSSQNEDLLVMDFNNNRIQVLTKTTRP